MKLFDLSGRTAVVVGGTSGIGRTLALGLAQAGADVIASGRRMDLVKDVSQEIKHLGRRTLPIAADVADIASLDRLRDECLEAFGKIDILLTVAGTTKKTSTLEMDEADWHRVIETRAALAPHGKALDRLAAQLGDAHGLEGVIHAETLGERAHRLPTAIDESLTDAVDDDAHLSAWGGPSAPQTPQRSGRPGAGGSAGSFPSPSWAIRPRSRSAAEP